MSKEGDLRTRTNRYVRDIMNTKPDMARPVAVPFFFTYTVAGGIITGTTMAVSAEHVPSTHIFSMRSIRAWLEYDESTAADIRVLHALRMQIQESGQRFSMFWNPIPFSTIIGGNTVNNRQELFTGIGYNFEPGSDVAITLSFDSTVTLGTNGTFFGNIVLLGNIIEIDKEIRNAS